MTLYYKRSFLIVLGLALSALTFQTIKEMTQKKLHNKDIFSLAKSTDSIQELGPKIRTYSSKWSDDYRDLISTFKQAGYSFTTLDAINDEKLKTGLWVILRFDIHQRDIIPTFAIMDLNQQLNLPADFYLQIPDCSQDLGTCKSYSLLKKHKSNKAQFGLHISPVDDWLADSFFNQTADQSYSQLLKISAQSNMSLDQYLFKNSLEHFRICRYFFTKLFGELRIASAHGMSGGVTKKFQKLIRRDKHKYASLKKFRSRRLLMNNNFQATGKFLESYTMNLRPNLIYISDNATKSKIFYQKIYRAIANKNSIQLLMHPDAIHRTNFLRQPNFTHNLEQNNHDIWTHQ